MNFPIGAGQMRGYEGRLQVEGRLGEEPRPGDAGGFDVVTPGYFETMRVSLVDGRLFTHRDRAGTLPVAVVNERMAAHYWPDDGALGKRFTFDPTVPEPEWFTVVGVVANFGSNFWGEPPGARVYLPHAQRPFTRMTVTVRTAADPFDAIASLRATVHGVDAGVPLSGFLSVDDHVDIWLNETRVIASMIGGIGMLALGLASIGLFGMVSYSVVQRTREIGVRVALGARRATVMRLVFGRSLRLAAIGIGIGLVLSLAVGLALISLVYGVEAPRPATVVGVLVLFVVVALLAAYVPARRATRIDPLEALRAE
jgi:predicted permease